MNVVDTTPPVLTLNGANPMPVEAGSVFTDPGATATDTLAGDLTAQIQVTGDVNTQVVASYTRTYTVTDGFNPTTRTRTVNVVDTTAPDGAGHVAVARRAADGGERRRRGADGGYRRRGVSDRERGGRPCGPRARRRSGPGARRCRSCCRSSRAVSCASTRARPTGRATIGLATLLVDNDGTPTALDRSRSTGVDLSGSHSNDFSNGITAGTLTRNGWTTRLSNAPTAAGVRATASGTGTIARVSACVGAAKEVRLDVAGETADMTCTPVSGTITVKAISAVPQVELREQLASGAWQQFNLRTGQLMSVGSPATASRANRQPIAVRLLEIDEAGARRSSAAISSRRARAWMWRSCRASQAVGGQLQFTVLAGPGAGDGG